MNKISNLIFLNIVAARNLGPWGYALHKMAARRARSEGLIRLRARRAKFPLACRLGTSDPCVFNQIFVNNEYSCIDDVSDVRFMIDCGANVGYSSAYFLSRHPRAYLVAIEPDPGNFAMLRENLSRYGSRAEAINAGVWSHSCGLVLSEDQFGDGREWARHVRECLPGEETQVDALDIETLLKRSGFDRIDILKVDVEGAEGVIFSRDCRRWLDRVENLVIELHGDENTAIFFDAIEGQSFEVSRYEELTVCKRRPPSA